MLWVAEVDLNVGCDAKAVVIGHFRSPVPSQRFIEFPGEFAGVSYQRVNYSLRILAGHFYQHHESTLTFDERCNLARRVAIKQVAFPVPRYCAILRRSGALTDRHSVANVRTVLRFQCVMTGPTHGSKASQMLEQFLFSGRHELECRGSDRLSRATPDSPC